MEKIKVGLLGCGTVGSGTYKILEKQKEKIEILLGKTIEITKIVVNDMEKPRPGIDRSLLTKDVNEVLEDPTISVVVEVMGTMDLALSYMKKALSNGKSVVTANKDVISMHGDELLKLAEVNQVDFLFEASVCGGIPIIGPLKRNLVGNSIEKIVGILNGTTNYILSKMGTEGLDYQDVLKEAQDLGYAESDPTSDVEGLDAARKLAILSSIAFRSKVTFDDVYCEGISSISKKDIKFAADFGYTIKLLGVAENIDDELEVKVFPALIPTDHPLASVNDTFNSVYIVGDAVGETMFYGRGAGELPTGSAVVGDIIEAVRHKNGAASNRIYCTCKERLKIKHVDNHMAKFFFRLTVTDIYGTLAKYTAILAKYKVSVRSITQTRVKNKEAELVIITETVQEKFMYDCMKELEQSEVVTGIKSVIRVVE